MLIIDPQLCQNLFRTELCRIVVFETLVSGDVATASLIETWVDEAERRTWYLSEVVGD